MAPYSQQSHYSASWIGQIKALPVNEDCEWGCNGIILIINFFAGTADMNTQKIDNAVEYKLRVPR